MIMLCPYNRKKLIQSILTTYEKDDNDFTKSTKQVLQEDYTLMDCTKEQCGVYQNGRCCYQVVQLND